MNKVLIDAGRSSFGWSRIGTFSRCPQLFAYGQRLNLEMIPAHALTRGSMGHILQAHQHAIWGAATAAGVWGNHDVLERHCSRYKEGDGVLSHDCWWDGVRSQ